MGYDLALSTRFAPQLYGGHGIQVPRLALPIHQGLTIAMAPNQHGELQDYVWNIRPSTQDRTKITAVDKVHGRGIRFATAGALYTDLWKKLPRQPPFSVFAHIQRQSSSNSIQGLIGIYTNGGGWTFQQSYGSGQIGVTFWGVGDVPSTALGAVPIGVPSSVGLIVSSKPNNDGGLMFMDGKFDPKTYSNAGTLTGDNGYVGCYGNSTTGAMQDTVIYCIYVWNRELRQQDFLRLWADPWLPLRYRVPTRFAPVAAAGSGAGLFIPAMLG